MKQVNIACFPIIRPWLIITGVCWYSKYLDTASLYILSSNICPAFRKYPGISIEGKNFAAKRIFIKFDRNNNFFYIYTKKNTIKNLKDISLCQIKWMKWKCLTKKCLREREKERKIRNETTLNQYWEINRKDILILEKQILSTFFFSQAQLALGFSFKTPGVAKRFRRNARE